MVINGRSSAEYIEIEKTRDRERGSTTMIRAEFCSVGSGVEPFSWDSVAREGRRGKGGALLQGWFAKLFAPEGSCFSGSISWPIKSAGWQRKPFTGNERPCWPFFGQKTTGWRNSRNFGGDRNFRPGFPPRKIVIRCSTGLWSFYPHEGKRRYFLHCRAMRILREIGWSFSGEHRFLLLTGSLLNRKLSSRAGAGEEFGLVKGIASHFTCIRETC